MQFKKILSFMCLVIIISPLSACDNATTEVQTGDIGIIIPDTVKTQSDTLNNEVPAENNCEDSMVSNNTFNLPLKNLDTTLVATCPISD